MKNVAGHAVHRLPHGLRKAAWRVRRSVAQAAAALPPARLALTRTAPTRPLLADSARWRTFPRRECAALTVLGAGGRGVHHRARRRSRCSSATRTTPRARRRRHALHRGPARRAARAPRRLLTCRRCGRSSRRSRSARTRRLTFTSAHRTPDAIAFLAGHDAARTRLPRGARSASHLWSRAEHRRRRVVADGGASVFIADRRARLTRSAPAAGSGAEARAESGAAHGRARSGARVRARRTLARALTALLRAVVRPRVRERPRNRAGHEGAMPQTRP